MIITSEKINEAREALRSLMKTATSEREYQYLYLQLRVLSNSINCAPPLKDGELLSLAERSGVIGHGSTKQAHCLRVDANKDNLTKADVLVVLTQSYGNKGYNNQSYLQAKRFEALQILFDKSVCDMFLPVFRADTPRGRGSVNTDSYIQRTVITVPRAERITTDLRYTKQDEIQRIFSTLQHIGFYDCQIDNLGYLPSVDKVVCIDYGADFKRYLDEKIQVIFGERARR